MRWQGETDLGGSDPLRLLLPDLEKQAPINGLGWGQAEVGTGCYLVHFILVLGGQERRGGKRQSRGFRRLPVSRLGVVSPGSVVAIRRRGTCRGVRFEVESGEHQDSH